MLNEQGTAQTLASFEYLMLVSKLLHARTVSLSAIFMIAMRIRYD